MSITSQQLQLATRAINDIEAARQRAVYLVAASVPLDSAGKDATLKALKTTYVVAIGSLSTALNQVAIGKITWDDWVTRADALHADILYLADLPDEWGLLAALKGAARQTAIDVVDAAKSIAAPSAFGFGLVIGGFVLWKVFGR